MLSYFRFNNLINSVLVSRSLTGWASFVMTQTAGFTILAFAFFIKVKLWLACIKLKLNSHIKPVDNTSYLK